MAKSTLLTQKKVQNAKAADAGKRYELFDQTLPGFALRVTDKGRKSWVVFYRLGEPPKLVRYTIGAYPTLGLAEAREEAREALNKAREGINIAAKKRAEKKAARRVVADDDDGKTKYQPGTFGALAERFIRVKLAKEKRGHQIEAVIRNRLLADWGDRPIAEITKANIIEVRDRAMDEGKPAAASQLHEVLRRFFNWVISDRGLLEVSPMTLLKAPAPRVKRERVLTDAEVKSMWQACDDWPFGVIVRLLLVTAQRRSEVAGMRWQDIDMETGHWTLPDTKSGRPHVVPLPSLAMNIIRDLPQLDDTYVFATTRGGNPPSGFSRAKDRLERVSGVTGWRIHDLRRTARTNFSKLKIPPHVSERILNHAMRGVEGTYDRYDYLDEKAEALELWSRHLIGIVEADGEKVVRLLEAYPPTLGPKPR